MAPETRRKGVKRQQEDEENKTTTEGRANTRLSSRRPAGCRCSRIFHYHSIRTSFSGGLGGEEKKVIAIDSTRPKGRELKAYSGSEFP